MGPAYFVISIFGCADGTTACTPVMTVPTQYESVEACSTATDDALLANSHLDFPTLLAECRPGASKASADRKDAPEPLANSRRS